jgi:uncharacterized membrane protein
MSGELESTEFEDPISDFLSRVFSSPWFVYGSLLLALLWIGGNIVAKRMGYEPLDQPGDFFLLLLVMTFLQVFIPSFLLITGNAKERRDKRRAAEIYGAVERMEKNLLRREDAQTRHFAESATTLATIRLNQLRIMAAGQSRDESVDMQTQILLEVLGELQEIKEMMKGEVDESTGDAAGRRRAE